MGRVNKKYPAVPEEFAGKLALLDIRIDDDPLTPTPIPNFRVDDYYKQHLFTVEKWNGEFWVNLCEPEESKPPMEWPIAAFRTIKQACRAALNAKKHGYDWDYGDE